jgi:hypothetical protein
VQLPNADEVLIKVAVTGLCRTDLKGHCNFSMNVRILGTKPCRPSRFIPCGDRRRG